MFDLILTYSGDDGAVEIPVDGDRFSFGRGSDADQRFDDSGLSRLHATIYREDSRVWIVDENSSNGTFVNGEKVEAGGTPLYDGDTVRIGHHTNIKVEFRKVEEEAPAEPSADEGQTVASAPEAEERSSMLLPAILLGVAVLVIGASAIFVVLMMNGGSTEVAASDSTYDDPGLSDTLGEDDTNEASNGDNTSGTPAPGQSGTDPGLLPPGTTPDPLGPIISGPDGPPRIIPTGKTYQQMSESEKIQYIMGKAEIVSRVIGNSSGEAIPPAAAAKIKQFLDGYVSKIRSTRTNNCTMGGWQSSDMTSILLRARSNAPFIIRAFNEKGIDPQVGLYLAMIESEHCECLQSPTGPLGMFQFTQATGKRYGLEVRSGASPSNPDQRCEKEPAAKAAAAYMKALTGRIGTGPLSIPLAIASYNSGEGGLGKNLKTALEANESQERSFWTLVANSDKLAEQFQRENIKYVPKFFAAAIIGENPRDFGIDLESLSLYTR
ncbi:MAG: FHA domain-containing protein [Acidobacteriota bacterium]|nr:MAG: FHA domain-containing protein [Acidobacteriota bacterium]